MFLQISTLQSNQTEYFNVHGDEKESELDNQFIMIGIDTNVFECVLKFAYNNDPEMTENHIFCVMHICTKYKIQS